MSIGDLIQRSKMKVEKHSPELLIILGIGGVIASTIMACKATSKAKEVVDRAKDDLETVHTYAETGFAEDNLVYTEEDLKKDIPKIYFRAGLELAKLYAPAIVLGSASIGSVLMSNKILRQRNTALAAAYMAVDKGFKEYRSKIVEKYGEEVDRQIRHGIKEIEIEEVTTDNKGKEKVKKQKIQVADPSKESIYLKYFTRGNCHWTTNMDLNEYFIRMVQSEANDILRAKGMLTLNEVYELLGFQATKAGMVVGWIYDKKNPSGDNEVILDFKEECIMNEEGGFENAFAIDFNVDGNIYDLMS